MSGMESRAGDISGIIREIAFSGTNAGSLRNIIADLKYEQSEQPCWTEPLASPKNTECRPDSDERLKTYITDSDNNGRRVSP